MEHSKQVIEKHSDLFDQYLTEFQEDIRRIVGKFKKSFHALSDEEIYSECNLHLLKNKEKILNSFSDDQEFNQTEFKKIAYHYVKNECVWTHYRFMNKSYNRRKLDGYIETDDGTKTIFEAAIETQGKENEDIDSDLIFHAATTDQFFHVLTKYSYLLTEQEVEIISYIRSGFNQDQIAEKLEVTHQAISFCYKNIQAKLKSHFNFHDVLNGGSVKLITDGQKAIDSFFNVDHQEPSISKEDKQKIKNYILENPNAYTGIEINKKLFNSKYSNQKIWGAIKSLKLTPLVKSRNRLFTNKERELIFSCFKKGKTAEEVAKIIGIKTTSARRMREELVKKGKLLRLSELRDKSSEI